MVEFGQTRLHVGVVVKFDKGDAAGFGGCVAFGQEADRGWFERGEMVCDVGFCGAEGKVACLVGYN